MGDFVKIFHCLIIEGDEKIVSSKSKEICSYILGKEFEKKIKKNICSDVITLETKKSSIGVDDIRKINNDSILKPIECKNKVYIIKNSQQMTEQAQNALLKTIEEPPCYAYFLLLCDNSNKLLPTVRSRAQIIRMSDSDFVISDDHKLFVESLVNKNKFELLKVSSKFCDKRENLKKFLEISKIYLIQKIENDIKFEETQFLDKIDECINLVQYNINLNLIVSFLCT